MRISCPKCGDDLWCNICGEPYEAPTIDYEAAAWTAYDNEVGTEMPPWDNLPDEDKTIYREFARLVVDAAVKEDTT